jgi:VanZ family protein
LSTARRVLACAALCAAAFTAYGSLVPFEFRAPPPAAPAATFRAVLAAGPRVESRSDAIANVMLGLPLGFALLGAASADRGWSRARLALVGLRLLVPCALFAAAVEFSQLFTADRFCSATDIAAQTLGSAAGMAAWVLWGQRLADRALAVWRRADVDAAGRMLIAYLALLAFVEALPFDLNASPYGLYRKFKDGGVRLAPFGEFEGVSDAARWKEMGKLARLAGLFFPAGLLAALARGRIESWGVPRVALAALALGVCAEAPQLLVKSRTPGATDALVGACAAAAGWLAGRAHREGLALPFAVSWGVVWLAMMTPVSLPPAGAPRLPSPREFDWVPGLPLEAGRLNALEEMLTKLVLFGLLGVLVAAWRLPPPRRGAPGGSARAAAAIAGALGLLASGLFESTQRWYELHSPCVTDVLLGGSGAALGALAASLLRDRGGR